MATPIFIYGAGGHARVILEICEDAGRTILGIYDDNPGIGSLLGYPVRTWDQPDPSTVEGIIAIGDNQIRQKVASVIKGRFATVVNGNSYISRRSVLGEGTVAMSGTSVHSQASIGRHCIINTHASVDHDCRLGDYVHIAPGVVLCGHVAVGTGTLVGAGSVIIPGVKIGKWATIGAGSVIRRDVPDGVVVVGHADRIFKLRPNPSNDK
jgi:sugar O-acyltransferase (sialic acid O-acetyltransferase NeuD family)